MSSLEQVDITPLLINYVQLSGDAAAPGKPAPVTQPAPERT